MSAIPAEVPQCESAMAALTVVGESALARWDTAGRVTAASPSEQSATASVLGAVRFAAWGQLGVAVPTEGSIRSTESLSDEGFGLGDLRVGARLDPWIERDHAVPVFQVGARLPTGRDWTEASGPLLADVTGLPGVGGVAGAALQRSLGRVPWRLGLTATAEPDVPLELAGSFGAGRSFGEDWVLLGSVTYTRAVADGGACSTALSGRLVRGELRRWRSWAGISSDVPVPLVGRDGPVTLAVDLGIAAVR